MYAKYSHPLKAHFQLTLDIQSIPIIISLCLHKNHKDGGISSLFVKANNNSDTTS